MWGGRWISFTIVLGFVFVLQLISSLVFVQPSFFWVLVFGNIAFKNFLEGLVHYDLD